MNDGTRRCAHGKPTRTLPSATRADYVIDVAPDCQLCTLDLFEPLAYKPGVPMQLPRVAASVAELEAADDDPAAELGAAVATGALDCFSLAPAAALAPILGLPADAAGRKARPICTGVLDYFPDALAEVAHCSRVGNDQHNPGQPLHWAKGLSTDHADALVRHLLERGRRDTDGVRHSAKVAWRALALLQTDVEDERILRDRAAAPRAGVEL